MSQFGDDKLTILRNLYNYCLGLAQFSEVLGNPEVRNRFKEAWQRNLDYSNDR